MGLYNDLVEIRLSTEPKRRRLNDQQAVTNAALPSDSFRQYNDNVTAPPGVSSSISGFHTTNQINDKQQQQQKLTDLQGTVSVADLTTNLKSLLNRSCYAYFENVLYVARVINVIQSTEQTGTNEVRKRHRERKVKMGSTWEVHGIMS